MKLAQAFSVAGCLLALQGNWATAGSDEHPGSQQLQLVVQKEEQPIYEPTTGHFHFMTLSFIITTETEKNLRSGTC